MYMHSDICFSAHTHTNIEIQNSDNYLTFGNTIAILSNEQSSAMSNYVEIVHRPPLSRKVCVCVSISAKPHACQIV